MKTFSSSLGSIERNLVFRADPAPLPIHEITGFVPDESLSRYVVFADEEFNIGMAWYCEDTVTGHIYRVDPEYGERAEFVNSSMQAFLASLRAAADWSSRFSSADVRKDPKVIDLLATSLAQLDAEAFRSAETDWRSMIDHMRSYASDDDEEMEWTFEIA